MMHPTSPRAAVCPCSPLCHAPRAGQQARRKRARRRWTASVRRRRPTPPCSATAGLPSPCCNPHLAPQLTESSPAPACGGLSMLCSKLTHLLYLPTAPAGPPWPCMCMLHKTPRRTCNFEAGLQPYTTHSLIQTHKRVSQVAGREQRCIPSCTPFSVLTAASSHCAGWPRAGLGFLGRQVARTQTAALWTAKNL